MGISRWLDRSGNQSSIHTCSIDAFVTNNSDMKKNLNTNSGGTKQTSQIIALRLS